MIPDSDQKVWRSLERTMLRVPSMIIPHTKYRPCHDWFDEHLEHFEVILVGMRNQAFKKSDGMLGPNPPIKVKLATLDDDEVLEKLACGELLINDSYSEQYEAFDEFECDITEMAKSDRSLAILPPRTPTPSLPPVTSWVEVRDWLPPFPVWVFFVPRSRFPCLACLPVWIKRQLPLAVIARVKIQVELEDHRIKFIFQDFLDFLNLLADNRMAAKLREDAFPAGMY